MLGPHVACHFLKPCTDVASNFVVIDLGLDVRIACDDLQQKFQHAEYFTCDPLNTRPLISEFHELSGDS